MYKIQRHNLVRDLFIQFLRRHTPHRVEPESAVGSLHGTTITAEDTLGERPTVVGNVTVADAAPLQP